MGLGEARVLVQVRELGRGLGLGRVQAQVRVRVRVRAQHVQTHVAHCPFSVVVVVQAHETSAGAAQPLPKVQSAWEQAWVSGPTSGSVQAQVMAQEPY